MQHCPTCHQAGSTSEEIQARCGRFITCAKRTLEVDPTKEVVIECATCSVSLAVPVSAITSGKRLDIGAVCQRASESCEASVMKAPRGKPAKA